MDFNRQAVAFNPKEKNLTTNWKKKKKTLADNSWNTLKYINWNWKEFQ